MAKQRNNTQGSSPQGSGTPREPASSAAPARVPVKAVAAPRPADPDPSSLLEDLVPLGIGILAIAIARVVTPNIRDLFQLPKQLWMADGAAVLVALVGALAWMGRPYRFRTSTLVYAFAGLLGAIMLSMTIAPKHTGGVLSIFARYDAHRWLAGAAIFWVTIVAVRRPRHIWYLVGGLAIAGLVVALIGIGEQHNILGLLPEQRWAIISKPGSTFGNRNMAAQVVVAIVPVCYVAMAMAVRWFLARRTLLAAALMVPAVITLDLLLYYILLTVTRSAWAGAIFGLFAAALAWALGAFWANRTPAADGDVASPSQRGLFRASLGVLVKPVLALTILAGGIFVIADHYKPEAAEADAGDQKRNKSVVQLMSSFFDRGADHYRWRFTMLESSWEAIKQEPLGGGAGNWRVMFPKYLVQREKNEMFTIAKQPIRAHNDFLQFGVEYGWHGMLALFVLLGSAFALTVRAVKRAALSDDKDSEGAALLAFAALGSLVGIVAICGDAMASFPLQLPVPTFLFCLHMGVIAAADGLLAPKGDDPKPGPWPQWMAGGTVAVGLGALIFLQGWGNTEGLHGRWLIAEHGFTDARNHQKMGRDKLAQGLSEIREALAINPDDFQNHFIEALCLNSMGQTKEAIDSLHRSLALYPNLLNAWVNVAMFSARNKDEKSMNEAIDKALALKPDELVALNTRLRDYLDKGKNKEVLDLVGKQVPGYQAYRASGRWPADDNGQLLGAYKQTLNHGLSAARKVEDWATLAKWATFLDELGLDPERSEDSKRKETRERAAEIAESYRKLGKYDAALPWAQKAAELAANEMPDLKIKYAVTLAANGKYAEARHECQVAIDLDPPGSRPKLGDELRALKAAGKGDGAQIDQLIAFAQPQ